MVCDRNSKMIVSESNPVEKLHVNGSVRANGNMYVNGKLGIGVGTGFSCYDPNVRLAVNGHIKAKEVVVEISGWCDYRLKKDFKRMSWKEKESYISEHQHLPEIPAEKEVKEKGIYTSEIMKGILANTEDNTMDIIELYKEVEKLKKEVEELRRENIELKKRIKR